MTALTGCAEKLSLRLESYACSIRREEKAPLLPQLIVDTSEMLGVPLFTAEALLRFCEWSKEALRIEWARDPVQTCLRAGLTPPYSALRLAQPQQQSQYVQYRTASGRQGRSSVQSITIVIPRPLRTQCITIFLGRTTSFWAGTAATL